MPYLICLLALFLPGCGLFETAPDPETTSETNEKQPNIAVEKQPKIEVKVQPPEQPSQTLVKLDVAAMPNVNPNSSNQASPVELLVYELSSDQLFRNADLLKLYQQEAMVLGKTLLNTHRLMLAPGEKKQLNLEFQPATRFVGVAAAFSQYQQADWRKSIAIVPGTTNRLSIRLEARRIILSGNP